MAHANITKKWLKNHWAYSWWKYVLLGAICVMGVNVLFTTTAYRAPDHKKIEVFVCNGYVDQKALQDRLEPVFFEQFPDQEEFSVMNINLGGGDVYVQMQFTTYLAAQQGDVLLLPESHVYQLADAGADNAFLELSPYIESGVIDLEKTGIKPLMLKNTEGNEGIYALEADTLYGLFELGNAPENSYLCVTDFSGNEDTAAGVLAMMIEMYQTEKPENYDNRNNAAGAVPMF